MNKNVKTGCKPGEYWDPRSKTCVPLVPRSFSNPIDRTSTTGFTQGAKINKAAFEQEQNDIKTFGSVERANMMRAASKSADAQGKSTIKKLPGNLSGNPFLEQEDIERNKKVIKGAMIATPLILASPEIIAAGSEAGPVIESVLGNSSLINNPVSKFIGNTLKWGPSRLFTNNPMLGNINIGNFLTGLFLKQGIEHIPDWVDAVNDIYANPHSWENQKNLVGQTLSEGLNLYPGYNITKEAMPFFKGKQAFKDFFKDISYLNTEDIATIKAELAFKAAKEGFKFAKEYGIHSAVADPLKKHITNENNELINNPYFYGSNDFTNAIDNLSTRESTGIANDSFYAPNPINYKFRHTEEKYGGDQYGGEHDINKAYEIMKRGGYAKDARKKNGADWDRNSFQDYMMKKGGSLPIASQGNLGMYPQNDSMFSDLYTSSDREDMLMNLFKSGQIPLSYLPQKLQVQNTMQQDLFNGMLAGAPSADGVYRNYQVKDLLPRADVGKGMYADPNKNSPWTYDYSGGKWYGYNKGKKYDISGYQSSVDILNKAYPNVVNPPNTGTTSNTGTTNNANTGTTSTTTNTETANTGTTNANPRINIDPNLENSGLDRHIYLNMIASQSKNKAGFLPAMAAVTNLSDALEDSAQGYGLTYKGIKSLFPKKPTTYSPNIPIEQQNENRQAKTNLTQKLNEYKNDYVRPQSTPEVDPLAGGDFMSGLNTGYPTQGVQEPADWSRRDYMPIESKKAFQLSTNEYNDQPMRSPSVPLSPPLMRQEDYSPYEQWNQQIADPNSMYYNPYIKRGGGNIYLPKAVWGEELVGSPNPGTQSQAITGLTNPGATSNFGLYDTQIPTEIQANGVYKALQEQNKKITDSKGVDLTPKEKDKKQRKGPPVFNTAQAAKNVSELAFAKNFLGAFNDAKTQIDDSWNSNTSERINPQQGMMDYGNYTTNTTQGTNFRPNQMQYTQSPNRNLLSQNLMNLAHGGSIWDKYEDGAEVDINDLSYDDILKIYASGGSIDYI